MEIPAIQSERGLRMDARTVAVLGSCGTIANATNSPLVMIAQSPDPLVFSRHPFL